MLQNEDTLVHIDDPGAVIVALRRLAGILENKQVSWVSGGIIINPITHIPEDGKEPRQGIFVQANLVLARETT